MSKPFEDASYLSQVRRLRDLATRALIRYPIRVGSFDLIDHWENTTFRITATDGNHFVLRIHRTGYHNESGVLEEMEWLERLSKGSELQTPVPVRSKNDLLVETVTSPLIPQPRHCCLFRWIDGRFIRKSLSLSHMSQLGSVIATLHRSTDQIPVRHRRYWTAEGLVGTRPKFGSIDAIHGISTKNQDILSRGRELVFRKIRDFEKKFPGKLRLIHADLHFGNILRVANQFAVIDFDDCGLGFHVYDLAVSINAVEYLLPHRGKMADLSRMKTALIETYARERGWNKEDEAILPYFVTARRLLLLGWLNSRSDNPELKRRVKKAAAYAVRHLKQEYDLR